MRRGEIPGALLKARRADIDKIPDRVLAKMTRADLAGRLAAAGEYRRRASVPHLDGDLYRYRLGLAREVLVTADAERAAALVKGAGVGVTIGTGRMPARPATALRKDAPAGGERSVYVHTPTLDILGRSRSLGAGMTKLLGMGALGHLRRDIAAVEKASAELGGGKAGEYERTAAVVTDPELRRGYAELARRERARAGAA